MSKKVDKTNMGPMPWQEFVVGFQIASQALDNPSPEPGDPQDPDAKIRQPRQTAIERDPVLRVMMRTKEHFGDGYEHHASFMYRFWALMHLLRRGHIQSWITSSEENEFQSFHPAVLLAAAEVRLTNTAKFPVKRFVARVEAILEEDGGDDDE